MTPSRRDQADARRTQLIGVTLDLFVERGLENVTMAEVASRAGTTTGLLYHYFGSKDGLLSAALHAASPLDPFDGLARSLFGMPIAEGLREFCLRAAALFEERGDVVRALFREMLAPESSIPAGIADVQEQALNALAGYLAERAAAGELGPHDPRPPLRLLVSGILVLGVTRQPVEPWIEGFVNTVLHGIEAED